MTIPFKITLSKQKEGVQNWFIGPETGFKLKLRGVDFRGSVDTKAIWKASIKDIEPPSKTPLTCVRIAPVNFEEEVLQHALIGAVIFVDDAQNVRFRLSQIPNPSQPAGCGAGEGSEL